ncbi:hypothetical protein [Mixta gaviniae]|uniref:hypothetical protein n=1 Tax=Mixta gaviniae TaxID=665914 RepID=UPI0011B0D64F|nr:hypothetical protein [Mixta gaviniae]
MPVIDDLNEFKASIAQAASLRTKANQAASNMTGDERSLLYEAIFLRIYRAYENLLENIFIKYLSGENTHSGTQITTYLRPKDKLHARAMITSSQPYLDWTAPSTVIKRAETYIDGENPIKIAISSSMTHLISAKKIRNHIAHNSSESMVDFNKVVIEFLHTMPRTQPSSGEFLSKIPAKGPSRNKEILTFYMEHLESTAIALVG